MTKVQYRLAALSALATVALTLAACNSEPNVRASGPTTDAAPAATNSKITLEAYSKDRSAAVATTAAPQDVLRAALALAVPPLQSSLFTSNGPITWAEQAIVFPALQAARMDVLRAASAGDTLAEVQAAVPTAASLDVTRSLLSGLSRQLWASALLPSSAVFWPRLRSAARPLRPGRPTQFWIGLRRWQRWQSLVRPAT